MIFSIIRHRSSSTGYCRIISQLENLPEQPNGLTEIRIKIPPSRFYTEQQILMIQEQLLPLVVGQECLQFGKLDSLRSFWHDDGRLSGLGAIHLFAHLLLGRIALNRTLIQDPDCKVIRERIYRPNLSDRTTVSIVFTAALKLKAMRYKTRRAWKHFEQLLELGSPEPLDDPAELRELVAAG